MRQLNFCGQLTQAWHDEISPQKFLMVMLSVWIAKLTWMVNIFHKKKKERRKCSGLCLFLLSRYYRKKNSMRFMCVYIFVYCVIPDTYTCHNFVITFDWTSMFNWIYLNGRKSKQNTKPVSRSIFSMRW